MARTHSGSSRTSSAARTVEPVKVLHAIAGYESCRRCRIEVHTGEFRAKKETELAVSEEIRARIKSFLESQWTTFEKLCSSAEIAKASMAVAQLAAKHRLAIRELAEGIPETRKAEDPEFVLRAMGALALFDNFKWIMDEFVEAPGNAKWMSEATASLKKFLESNEGHKGETLAKELWEVMLVSKDSYKEKYPSGGNSMTGYSHKGTGKQPQSRVTARFVKEVERLGARTWTEATRKGRFGFCGMGEHHLLLHCKRRQRV